MNTNRLLYLVIIIWQWFNTNSKIWIYNYLCKQCLSPLTWNRSPVKRGVLDTTLFDKVCQWLTTCRWFSLGTPVSYTNKTNLHDIIEILLKVALNTITLTLTQIKNKCKTKSEYWRVKVYLVYCFWIFLLYLQIIRLNKVYKTDKQTLINTWSVNICPRNINVSCPAREIRIDKRTQEKRRQTIINKTKKRIKQTLIKKSQKKVVWRVKLFLQKWVFFNFS
jgi:hypothetical protein